MTASCVFCGATEKLTREHVFGDWLSEIGLPNESGPFFNGPLNRIRNPLGTSPPFKRTVREVCAGCNGGWMSSLEGHAKRVLTPLILGQSGGIDPVDQGLIAAWAQKNALVSMLVSSEAERQNRYGLPADEYQAMFANQKTARPVPNSQFWIGRYNGCRLASAVVTPLVVEVTGAAEPAWPNGYALTNVVGQVLIFGVRFTTPLLMLDIAPPPWLTPL